MNEKILIFETKEARFLRNVLEILQKIQSFSIPEFNKDDYFDDLRTLILHNIDYLPPHYYALLQVLNDIIRLQDDIEARNDAIAEAFIFCEFLKEPASFESFKKMALCDIPILYDHTGFSEELLFSIIEQLKAIKQSSSEKQDIDILSDVNTKNIMWISLAQMISSEQVKLKIIESVDLTGDDLITFCKKMSTSSNNSDKVLLAIIQLLESKRVFKNPKRDSNMKAQVYYTILLAIEPSEIVIKEIVKVLRPRMADYFNAFLMILQEFGKYKSVVKAVSERLSTDEQIVKIDTSSMNQLKLLANNL